MRKRLLLTFTFALLYIATWAQFAPETGKMYALKEKESGLYLDIQTLGINEANANTTTNNLSLNAKPCIIYFAAGTTDASKWTMRNVNGTYAMQASSRNWNATIGTTAYEWTINEPEASIYTIARADGKFINVDNKLAGQPLFCDKGTGMQFSLVDYSELCEQFTYTLKSDKADSDKADSYLSLTVSGSSAASFQETATEFYIKTSAGQFIFLEDKANEGTYIGSTHDWNATTDFSLWTMGEADENGYVYLTRFNDSSQHLGNTRVSNAGTGVFTNVPLSNSDGNCNKWLIEGTMACTTTAEAQNDKMHFTSGSFAYEGVCNKLRFTLTESGAFYQNGAKRLSFDSFVLYNANGDAITLTANNITGNNIPDFSGMIDNTDGTYSNAAWGSSSATDDWFEITLNEELGGAFSFSFVTENTTMNAKAFRVDISYEQRESGYTLNIENAPTGATITYNGTEVADGATIEDGFDKELFAATDVNGYTWSVAIDEAGRTITITYAQATIVENPAAVVALINRIGGEGTDTNFKFVLDPSMNSKNEVFVIGSEGGKVLIKGTTISAITTGIGWYLQNYAHINIAWNSLNEKTVSGDAYADLSSLPIPTSEETRTSDAMYRYYLNTCAFGYSMTSWTWKRWQQEIDWMALHGINMPLQLVGLEEVWRSFLTMEDANGTRKYGYTDEAAKAFVAGPAFIAWWAMNNLEGWGGTAAGTKSGGTWEGAGGVQDDAWYTRQKNLAKQICDRQRELGMQPVIPGWSGMVPTNFASKSGYATRGNGGNWAGDFVRPLLLSVSNAKYADIAADYYTCLHEVMGESQYYSMDPFHEGGGAGTMEDYEALYAAMEAAKPGSKWVIQQWQWSSTQKYSLTAVPAGRLVVLDLFSDGSPAFDSYSGYAPQDAVFCAIPNFGGRSGIMARLTNLANNYFTYKAKYSSIKGVGAAPEAIEQTPVTYDLIFQLPWMGSKPDVAEWVTNYSIARYGVVNAEIQEAWSLLRQGPLNYGADGIQGPVEDVWAAKPNLTANAASYWGKTMNHAIGTYTKARHQMLIDATYKLISQSSAIAQGTIYESNYNYDLVEFGGGVLADYAYYLLLGINEAKTASNTALYEARRDAFLQLILDVDAFKGTNLNFRLGKWTQEARDAAGEVVGATTATPDWYEYNNARTIVSTWSSPGTNLNDYSYRSWQGLMKDLYYPRWKHYFDNNCTSANYDYFAWNWAHGMEHNVGQTAVSNVALTAGQQGHTGSYTREPEGNTLEKAKEVLGKYIIPVASNSGTYYAYRCLTNDLSNICTVVADAGQTIDLSSYFGELTNVSITGDFIDGTATDIKTVTVKADATDGSHTGTITLADGTVLTFAVVLNPPYNGVYKLSYQSNGNIPVFIGYNADQDNSKNVGYKLIAQGTYSAAASGDCYFTITPLGTGYSISAQGMYLKQPTLGGWNHIMFSENKNEAGAYLFEETGTDTGIFKLRSTGSGINYVNDYDKLVFGNDNSTKENLATFSISKAATYPIEVSTTGTTICLPFNIVLPTGVVAYDVTTNDIESDGKGGYIYKLSEIATTGEILLQGTPAILKGKGTYDAEITMSSANAKGPLDGSLLRGTYLGGVADTEKYIYKLNGTAFEMQTGEITNTANSCWLEADFATGRITCPGIAAHKFYTIKDANGKYITGSLTSDNKIATSTANDANAIFYFNGNHLLSYDNGQYIGLNENDWGFEAPGVANSDILAIEFHNVGEGVYNIKSGNSWLHSSDTYVNSCSTQDAHTTEHAWTITEVTTLPVTIGSVGYSTLYAPVALEIPNGVTAYRAEVNGEHIDLYAFNGTIPANQAVILKGAANTYQFTITTDVETTENNVLLGTIEKIPTNSVSNPYTLQSDVTAENGVVMRRFTGDYINGFKMYMSISDAEAAAFSFRFPGTTAVESVEAEGADNGCAYDLFGRPVENPTKGLYIINGKKVIY